MASEEQQQAWAASLAITEATRLYNVRTLRVLAANGYTKKQWGTALDHLVRPAHAELEGQVAPLDAEFATSGGSLLYPGDPTAPPDLTMNCRCVLFGVRN